VLNNQCGDYQDKVRRDKEDPDSDYDVDEDEHH
jgi:hypothetical protein